MNETTALLQQLGFAEYEAKAYVALLGRSPLNGYELAKVSGLPRANVYGVLQRLEERGAVVRLDTPSGTRYAPVPPSELIPRLGDRFQESLERAKRALEGVAAPVEREPVWNAEGYDTLLEHARGITFAANESLLVAVWPQEAAALTAALTDAERRGVRVTTLCMAACPHECGHCRSGVFRYGVADTGNSRWLVLAADDAELLMGEVLPGEQARLVRTRQRLLVQLAGDYIRDSIALASIIEDAGERLDGLLRERARMALSAVGPVGSAGGWLERMRALLARPGPIGGA